MFLGPYQIAQWNACLYGIQQWFKDHPEDEIYGDKIDFELNSEGIEEMQTKSITFKNLKTSDSKGSVTAVFATLEVVDRQGDVVGRGSIGSQDVVISAYGHTSHVGALPVGKGRIYEEGNQAVFTGTFFMNTQSGKEHYETIKAMGSLQEWSFNLMDTDFDYREVNGRRVRYLKRIGVKEISPVLLGAGINTHTVNIKAVSADDNIAEIEYKLQAEINADLVKDVEETLRKAENI